MNRLKQLRKEKNLTLKETTKLLSDKKILTITPDGLAKYERGKRKPDPDVWRALADFFGVSVPYLQGYLFAKCHWCGNSFILMNESDKDRYYYCPYCGRTSLDFGDMDKKYDALLKAMVEQEKNKSEINE